MRTARSLVSFVALATMLSLLLAACGGGGQGLRVGGTPLTIENAALPLTLTGETVDWEVPLAGGCGGPYVVDVIAGELPRGVAPEGDLRHHLTGIPLDAGVFAFTLRVVDTGCTPFSTTTRQYSWDVGAGDLVIIGGTPPLIPAAAYDDPQKYPDVPAVEPKVYGEFGTWGLVAAGGVPPYACDVWDDPADPDDGGLPLGVGLAPNSCTVVGTPVQVGAGGRPFRLTMRVTDAVGAQALLKVQWKVATPPIIVANTSLPTGRAGTAYADVLQIVDGVPPFMYELLDDAPTVANEDITYSGSGAPTFPSNTGFTVSLTGGASNKIGPGGGSTATYPAPADVGPAYTPYPSEGMYLSEDGPAAGTIAGTPRRVGTFTIHAHVYSALVPNERGQHAFQTLQVEILPSDPPAPTGNAFGMNPAFTVEGSFPVSPNLPTLPEFEQGQSYNPDSATFPAPGLQLLANGGVPADGWTDAPHASQRLPDIGEVPGSYEWSSDFDPDGTGLPNPPAGIDTLVTGDLVVTTPSLLERSSPKQTELTVADHQLPTPLRNVSTRRFNYSIGPDILIITHSTSSLSQTVSYYSAAERHEWNDTRMTVQKFLGYQSGPTRKVLDDTDLPVGHTVPAAAGLTTSSNPLGMLLSGVTGGDANLDLMRCVVNATGWWDDLHGMNPLGARPGAKADANMAYAYYGEFGVSYSYSGNFQPSVSAVEIPNAENVSGGHDPQSGVYTDGGQLYHFESATRFGVFVIRKDGRVYVPFAYKKDGTLEGFGDGVLESKADTDRNSALRTVQMTVSPDGRVAAMKLKRDQEFLYEHASDSRILLISLTGEKLFGGSTYKIVDTGVATTGIGNRIMYASSMALTNSHLYFLIGTQSATSNSTSSTPLYLQTWQGHFLMRYDVMSSDVAGEMIPSSDSAWTQATDVPMQSVFHHHGPHYTSTAPGVIESYTYYGRWPYHRYWQEQGMNFHEHNVAPAPFRVSRDGSTVAFFAAENYTGTSSTLVYSNYAWVDYQGTGARRISKTRRHHTRGGARGYTLVQGPSEYAHWGRYAGPTPGVEISDDGLQVAFVHNTYSGSVSASASYSISPWLQAREDVVLCQTTAGDRWATLASTDEEEVTKNTFTAAIFWRFGALAFTKDGSGLVFWAGAPGYYPNSTSTTYCQSYNYVGTFYHHDVTTDDRVVAMLGTSEGGTTAAAGTIYTAASPFNPSTGTGLSNRYGSIYPMGGFMSRNRDFMYVVAHGSISSSDPTADKLVGLNVSTLNSGNINGHTNGRGFVPASWPSRRGFIGYYYYYYGTYYPMYYGYAPMGKHGWSQQVMARDTGWVFWGTGYQYSGPTSTTTAYYGTSVYPVAYYGVYGYGGVGMYGFNADVGGPVAQLNEPSLSSPGTTQREMLNFIDVTPDGSRLTYVSTNDYYLYYKERELVNEVHNIDFSAANGAMHAAFDRSVDAGRLEASNGRAGEAMSTSTVSGATYYAFKAGAGNETQKEIVKAIIDPATGAWQQTRYSASALTGRINVLYATR